VKARVNALLMALAVTAVPAAAQPASPVNLPVVVTTGQGVVKHAPDRAWVRILAESRARSPRDAQRANADAMSAVMQKLKGAGLPGDAIKTTTYDLQPEFDYNNGRQTLRGYVARNGVEVRLDDIARVGEIVDMAVGSGATSVGGVRFDLKDRAGAEREALRLAVADAKARAEAAASGAGGRIEQVIRIEEQRVFGPEPRPMAMMRTEGGMAEQVTPIAPGEVEIRATVTLTAALR